MQAEVVVHNLTTSGVSSSAMFGMDEEDAAHIFSVLRGSLYSNKERAVLREYACNAWDEHQDAGIPGKPIKVVLPTTIEPTLVIRDYGRGLSEKDVFGIYAKYGKSTKRSKPDAVGFLGLGSKSAFCYSDTFTITSHHKGRKSVYIAAIDETDVGKVMKLHSEPCSRKDTGVEIRIPVRPEDIDTFTREATYLFRFMSPSPDINIALPEPPVVKEQVNGYILGKADANSGHVWTAIMGPVPYRLDLTRMMPELRAEGLEDLAKSVTGGLFFKLGEVSVAAHREELEYTQRTKNAVVATLKRLFSEIMGEMEAVTANPQATPWAKRLAVHAFRKKTGLPVPGKYAVWASPKVTIYTHERLRDGDGNWIKDSTGEYVTKAPRTFRISGFPYKKQRSRYDDTPTEHMAKLSEWPDVEVLSTSRLIIRDTNLPLRGYRLTVDDHVVTPHGVDTSDPLAVLDDSLTTELSTWLEQVSLTGIPVLRMSEMTWDPKAPSAPRSTRSGATFNQKHVERHFVLREFGSHSTPYSRNWDIIDRVPQATDLYVVLSHFQAISTRNFYHDVVMIRHYVKFLGGVMPTIVGVKSLQKDPVDRSKLSGTPYETWRKTVLQDLLAKNAAVQAKLDAVAWLHVGQGQRHYGGKESLLDVLLKHFPVNHPLVKHFTHIADGKKVCDALSKDERATLNNFYMLLGRGSCEPQKSLDALYVRYPLLSPQMHGPDFGVMTSTEAEPWLDYIRRVDQESP